MRINTVQPVCVYRNQRNNPAFLGSNFLLQRSDVLSKDKLEKEVRQAKDAREVGISVPKYKVQCDDEQGITKIRYKTNGDVADIEKNPVKSKHLRKLFKNLYYMDSAGIFHNDLDSSHIFFSDDGEVEFDCFRYSINFHKRRNGTITGNDGSIRTPDFMMPSNERLFEEQFLGDYVSKIGDEDEEHYFIRNYLFYRSEYHQKREAMLLERRFPFNSKTVQYEGIQAALFLHPSFRVVDYEVNKLNTLRLKREAFTQWDEGGGACGHKVDPEKRFDAILTNLDCIAETIYLRNEAGYYAGIAPSAEERAYFAFEEEIASKQLSDLLNDTKGMGGWNFNDTNNNIFLGTQDEKEFFEELLDDINPSDSNKAMAAIADVKEYYTALKDRWDKNLNAVLAQEY